MCLPRQRFGAIQSVLKYLQDTVDKRGWQKKSKCVRFGQHLGAFQGVLKPLHYKTQSTCGDYRKKANVFDLGKASG